MKFRPAHLVAAAAIASVIGIGGMSVASAQEEDDATTTTEAPADDSATTEEEDRGSRGDGDCPHDDEADATAESDAATGS